MGHLDSVVGNISNLLNSVRLLSSGINCALFVLISISIARVSRIREGGAVLVPTEIAIVSNRIACVLFAQSILSAFLPSLVSLLVFLALSVFFYSERLRMYLLPKLHAIVILSDPKFLHPSGAMGVALRNAYSVCLSEWDWDFSEHLLGLPPTETLESLPCTLTVLETYVLSRENVDVETSRAVRSFPVPTPSKKALDEFNGLLRFLFVDIVCWFRDSYSFVVRVVFDVIETVVVFVVTVCAVANDVEEDENIEQQNRTRFYEDLKRKDQ